MSAFYIEAVPSDWSKIRELIPSLEKSTYLMSAAVGPLHPVAFQIITEFNRSLKECDVAKLNSREAEIDAVRADVAKFLHCKQEEIAFISSSALAMNLFAMLTKDRRSDLTPRATSMEHEFPTSTLPWMHQGFEMGLVTADQGTYSKENIERKIRESKSQVLISSHVQFCTGYRQDVRLIGEIGKEQDLVSVVNATQSIGAFDVDASSVDFLCASTHKWLMAGFALSIVKIGERFLQKRFPLHGWLSESEPWLLQNTHLNPTHTAKALEVGTPPIPQILAVGAVIRWIFEMGGIEGFSRRILEVTQLAKDKLTKASIPLCFNFSEVHTSGILIVPCENAKGVVEALAKLNIFVSPRGKGIRLAFHYFNNEEDIDRFITAFKSLRIPA